MYYANHAGDQEHKNIERLNRHGDDNFTTIGGGREEQSEGKKGHAAKMNVCCCNSKSILIAVLYSHYYAIGICTSII